jgi:Fur family iron response transcriptional regulator
MLESFNYNNKLDSDMSEHRSYSEALATLKKANLRPTRQRLALCHLLFDKGNRHIRAETLHEEAQRSGISVSLATVYNALHQFTNAGLLRQVVVDGACTYFDTNVTPHQHFFIVDDGELMDVPGPGVNISDLPPPPEGTKIDQVEVIVRVSSIA